MKSPTSKNITEFTKRVKSVLWRQDSGKEKKSYDTWKARVDKLESKDGAGYSRHQAVVQASKDFPCLSRLFREYDLSALDPNPDSHPVGTSPSGSPNGETATCEDRKLTYRENLQWAMDTAGEFLCAGKQPTSYPNNAAWYLYEQAKADPKDFLGKVGQVESKGSGESEDERNTRKSGKRSIREIDDMLSELEAGDEGYDDTL